MAVWALEETHGSNFGLLLLTVKIGKVARVTQR